MEPEWLVVGLGNPGEEYADTPHNLGFLTVDRLAERHGIRVTRKDSKALVGVGEVDGQAVMLAKPQTFMNLSGPAVACLISKLESEAGAEKLIVISDDLALPFGTIRIRPRGSAGGHNGLKSIIGSLGSEEFTRLRIGIQPEHLVSDVKRFVLDPLPRSVRAELEEILERSAAAVHTIIRDGVLKAMAAFN